MASWLIRALTLGLLAITLPLAARGLYGPRGALVNVRWQPSADVAERQRLETQWQLVDGQEISPSTWRYDLTAPSEGRLRAIVAHAAVADTHNIDRERYTIAPEAPRTARRHGLMTAGSAIAVGLVDLLALLLGALAGLCVGRPAFRGTDVPRDSSYLHGAHSDAASAAGGGYRAGAGAGGVPDRLYRGRGADAAGVGLRAPHRVRAASRGDRRHAATFRLSRYGGRRAGAHAGRLGGRGGNRDVGGRGRLRRRAGVVAAGGAE